MRRILFWLFLAMLSGCGEPPPVTAPEPKPMQKKTNAMIRYFSADVPEVGRVRFAVKVAESYHEATPAPLVLLLHFGYRGSQPAPYTGAQMIEIFGSAVDGVGGAAIAPDAVGGDWTDPRNEKAAVWLVESAMGTYNIDAKKVIITGFSMGGKGTWFIGSRHQDLFTAAVPIAAPVAGGENWKIPIHVIHSDQDKIVSYSAAKRHADAVKAAGGDIQFTTAKGLSHYDTGKYQSYFAQAIELILEK